METGYVVEGRDHHKINMAELVALSYVKYILYGLWTTHHIIFISTICIIKLTSKYT
jgi:hypothetical protein